MSVCVQSKKNHVSFGTQYHRGYAVVANLFAKGILDGSLTCNERTEMCATSFGNKSAAIDYKYKDNPENIIIASNPETINYANLWRQAFDPNGKYKLNIVLTTNGTPTTKIYSLTTSTENPIMLDAEKHKFEYRELMAQKP